MQSGVEIGSDRARSERGPERAIAHLAPRPPIAIRGGAGLGDAIYLQSIARHLIEGGERVEACSDWPDVFSPLGERVTVSPFRRTKIDRLAHYSMRRQVAGSKQFEDMCIQAGIAEPVALRLTWRPLNLALLELIKADHRPVIVVPMPRAPFARKDGFGKEFLPDCRVIQAAIDRLSRRALIVQIGAGECLYRYNNIELDLAQRTTVKDVLDIGYAADGFLGFCSFIVPLAESLAKPALFVWSRRGLSSPQPVVRTMTPQKILQSSSSRFVIDNCAPGEIESAADNLFAACRS